MIFIFLMIFLFSFITINIQFQSTQQQAMKLLRLPSAKALILASNEIHKPYLKMLPFQCEDYCTNDIYFACHYYKAVSIYHKKDLENYCTSNTEVSPKPIIKEDFPKKIEAIDLYTGKDKKVYCIVSDKFGDIHRIDISESNQQKQSNAVYLNSNLGIPKYIKYQQQQNKEYLVLGDQQKRIKVYNSNNAHELLTVWHMFNRHTVQIQIFQNKILFLLKYFDQVSLQENIQLNWITKDQLQEQEYPGKNIEIISKFDKNSCLYYSLGRVGQHKAIIVLLTKNSIIYEVIENKGQNFKSLGKSNIIEIEQGNWDYLDIIDIKTQINEQILVSYGKQVEIPQKITDKEIILETQFKNKSLNSNEKIIKITI